MPLRVLLLLLFLSILPAALLAGGAATQEPTAAALPVAVFLLRHAETEASTLTERDPALSDAGKRRAKALGRLLGQAGVTRLYASEYRRTAGTLAPLAGLAGLEVVRIPAQDSAQQVAALRALPPGSVAAVAGHSNTIPGLVQALGGDAGGVAQDPRHGAMLAHDEYDRLFLVVIPGGGNGAVQTLELRYGE